MKFDNHSGLVSLDGIGASSARAIMYGDEYGNSAAATWDENGNPYDLQLTARYDSLEISTIILIADMVFIGWLNEKCASL